jgi:hypothetical protein
MQAPGPFDPPVEILDIVGERRHFFSRYIDPMRRVLRGIGDACAKMRTRLYDGDLARWKLSFAYEQN